jgi:hypothetical protein
MFDIRRMVRSNFIFFIFPISSLNSGNIVLFNTVVADLRVFCLLGLKVIILLPWMLHCPWIAGFAGNLSAVLQAVQKPAGYIYR